MIKLKRLIRADDRRTTRFHDGKGRLHLHPDMLRSAVSTYRRHAHSIYPTLPWLTYPAIAQIKKLVAGRRVFEFGAGTSTIWFAKNARQVVSVENNNEWYERSAMLLKTYRNANVVYIESEDRFLDCLDGHEPFDVYLIDCQSQKSYDRSTEELRIMCMEMAFYHGGPEALYVIDNTDVNTMLDERIDVIFSSMRVRRFSGWVPGIFHPNETTLVMSAT